jgi:hypothetical protein
MKKIQALTQISRATHIPVFFGSTDLRGSEKFSGGSENCCRNPTSGKRFRVLGSSDL